MPPALDLLAGSAAGGTAVVLTYPLDLVRTRLAFMTEAGGVPSSSRAQPQAAARSPLAAFRSAVVAAARSSSGGGSSGGAAGRAPYSNPRYSGAGLLLSSSRGCSSGACASGRGGLSSAAARLGAGLSLPSSSISAGSCSSRVQGQAAARSLHSLHLLPHHQPHHTIRSILASTLRREGVRGLYHGVSASMYG